MIELQWNIQCKKQIYHCHRPIRSVFFLERSFLFIVEHITCAILFLLFWRKYRLRIQYFQRALSAKGIKKLLAATYLLTAFHPIQSRNNYCLRACMNELNFRTWDNPEDKLFIGGVKQQCYLNISSGYYHVVIDAYFSTKHRNKVLI